LSHDAGGLSFTDAPTLHAPLMKLGAQ